MNDHSDESIPMSEFELGQRYCPDCGCPASRCESYGPGRKCCPDCKHRAAAIPCVDENDWFYLLRFPDGTVAQCAGDWDVAHKHLRLIRAEPGWPKGGPVPTLIGAYGPNRIGGPEGRGGVYSYGYTPTLIGSIDVPRGGWIRV